jgi:hypothetical protein
MLSVFRACERYDTEFAFDVAGVYEAPRAFTTQRASGFWHEAVHPCRALLPDDVCEFSVMR